MMRAEWTSLWVSGHLKPNLEFQVRMRITASAPLHAVLECTAGFVVLSTS
jgi:hypothetical protein